MYRILYGSEVLHDPRDPDRILTDATAELEVNGAGELSFTVQPNHPLRGTITPMNKHQEVVLEQDGEELFRGRVRSVKETFYGAWEVVCEGELAYLNDVILRPYTTGQEGVPSSVDSLFAWYVEQYNLRTEEAFRFTVGINEGWELGVENRVETSSDSRPNIAQEIKEKLLQSFGGYIRTRRSGGLRYIDWLASGDKASSQRIEFGENLLDFTRDLDWADYYTVLVPCGDAPEAPEGEGELPRVDISSEPDGELTGGLYKLGDGIVDVQAASMYGFIERAVEFEGVTSASSLVDAAARHLRNVQIGDVLEIKAVDLHMIDPTIKPIHVGDFVRATSKPHGYDEWFVCSKMTVVVNNPAENTFTLGNEYGYMTGKQSAKLAALNASVNSKYQEMAKLTSEAKAAASTAVTAVVDEYAVSDSQTAAPTTGWSTDTPEVASGQYVWRRVATTYGDGSSTVGAPAVMSGRDGESATVLRMDSSRGTVFKNSEVSTVLTAVIYHGSQRIEDAEALATAFGDSAYLEWSWQRLDEDRFGVISAEDARIGNDGFTLTLTPEDVDTKAVFMCTLITD